uniref:Uncharacterized protein n=1 Tax=Esox lucius TaxID=8010 RepID=A0AAY5L4S2_ESOLU
TWAGRGTGAGSGVGQGTGAAEGLGAGTGAAESRGAGTGTAEGCSFGNVCVGFLDLSVVVLFSLCLDGSSL